MQLRCCCVLKFLAGNWPETAPNKPLLPDVPFAKRLKTNLRLLFSVHGMEEVAGSIAARSTNSLTLKRLPLRAQAERGCLKRAVDVSATSLLIGESQII
jgi:hypothetical protein